MISEPEIDWILWHQPSLPHVYILLNLKYQILLFFLLRTSTNYLLFFPKLKHLECGLKNVSFTSDIYWFVFSMTLSTISVLELFNVKHDWLYHVRHHWFYLVFILAETITLPNPQVVLYCRSLVITSNSQPTPFRPSNLQGIQSHLTRKEPLLCLNYLTFQFDFFSHKSTMYDVFCIKFS